MHKVPRRYIVGTELPLVVQHFVFGAVQSSKRQRLVGLSFLQLSKTSSEFTFCHPTFECLRRGTLYQAQVRNINLFPHPRGTMYHKIGNIKHKWYAYELVQAYDPKHSSATNVACNSISNVTCLVSSWPPWKVEEGDIEPFFSVKDLGLALAPKMCPDQSQTFKEMNNSQAFTAGKKKIKPFLPIFTLNKPLPGAPRHVLFV